MSQVLEVKSRSGEQTSTLRTLLDLQPEQLCQRQDGTDAQLETVEAFLAEHAGHGLRNWEKAVVANRLGAYDAADIYKIRSGTETSSGR